MVMWEVARWAWEVAKVGAAALDLEKAVVAQAVVALVAVKKEAEASVVVAVVVEAMVQGVREVAKARAVELAVPPMEARGAQMGAEEMEEVAVEPQVVEDTAVVTVVRVAVVAAPAERAVRARAAATARGIR